MFRGAAMCSPQWMPLSHNIQLPNVQRNSTNAVSSNSASNNGPLQQIEYLPQLCIDQITAAQLSGINPYAAASLLSLLPYDYSHCAALSKGLKAWMKQTQSLNKRPQKPEKEASMVRKENDLIPEPESQRRKSLTPDLDRGQAEKQSGRRRALSQAQKHHLSTVLSPINNDNSGNIADANHIEELKNKPELELKARSACGATPTIQLTEPEDEYLQAPPSRKRKHPSGGSNCDSAGNKHLLTSLHMRARSGSMSSTSSSRSCSSFPPNWDSISYEIWELYLENKQSTELFNKKIQLRATVYKIIKAIDLYIVGSSLNGLGSNTSDVDMCLVVRSGQEINQMTQAIPILKYVKNILSEQLFVKNLDLIIAKVPLLKFTDVVSGVEVDLNVNNVVGIRNTQLIKCYTRLDWRVQPLVLAVKTWAHENGINDAHNKTISSYTLVLMVIHFLQCGCEPPVLPCLHKLMPDKFLPDSDITTLNLYEELPSFSSENEESLGQLFLGFLDYYSHKFDYKTYAISIRAGSTIPKYMAREHRSTKNTPSQWKYICVEEPFDRTNTARSVYDEEAFNRIIDVFRRSYYRLKTTKNLSSILHVY